MAKQKKQYSVKIKRSRKAWIDRGDEREPREVVNEIVESVNIEGAKEKANKLMNGDIGIIRLEYPLERIAMKPDVATRWRISHRGDYIPFEVSRRCHFSGSSLVEYQYDVEIKELEQESN